MVHVIGRGKTATVFRDMDRAIKRYVNQPFVEVQNEAMRQQYAYNQGLPVPAVLDVRKLDENRSELVMEYVDGRPLIGSKSDKDERRQAICELVKLQCCVHRVQATGLPKQQDVLFEKIQRVNDLDKPDKDKVFERLLKSDNNENNLCHGDFHPQNILCDGKKHWIIDWVDATAGNPVADACRTYLIFKQYMSRSSGLYLSMFCKTANVKKEDVLMWLPVIAAARLNENMEDKMRAALMTLIQNILMER